MRDFVYTSILKEDTAFQRFRSPTDSYAKGYHSERSEESARCPQKIPRGVYPCAKQRAQNDNLDGSTNPPCIFTHLMLQSIQSLLACAQLSATTYVTAKNSHRTCKHSETSETFETSDTFDTTVTSPSFTTMQHLKHLKHLTLSTHLAFPPLQCYHRNLARRLSLLFGKLRVEFRLPGVPPISLLTLEDGSSSLSISHKISFMFVAANFVSSDRI